ncbi:Hypothetical_protein [Hexamita inflata]|uniref:Hypothetical_protein n=1 Tax=Hexamita inflata TaxID=28002 RepID=A0AA86NV84_9EUKA|nr:Hypothetical protein HINF_LOCUS13340 [Hexamita inflata]
MHKSQLSDNSFCCLITFVLLLICSNITLQNINIVQSIVHIVSYYLTEFGPVLVLCELLKNVPVHIPVDCCSSFDEFSFVVNIQFDLIRIVVGVQRRTLCTRLCSQITCQLIIIN